MSNQAKKEYVQLHHIMYYDQKWIVISNNDIVSRELTKMGDYIERITGVSFMVNGELYIQESSMFHLLMKYGDTYDFI